MQCGMRCGAVILLAYVAGIAALTWILVGGVAAAQVQHSSPDGRPVFGIALVCGTLEPGQNMGCQPLRTRESFPTREACVAAMPALVEGELDRLVRRYPRAELRAQWNCTTLEGVYDS